jgi:hypothetical protein
MAYLLLDMVDPSESRFPAYELWETQSVQGMGLWGCVMIQQSGKTLCLCFLV